MKINLIMINFYSTHHEVDSFEYYYGSLCMFNFRKLRVVCYFKNYPLVFRLVQVQVRAWEWLGILKLGYFAIQ